MQFQFSKLSPWLQASAVTVHCPYDIFVKYFFFKQISNFAELWPYLALKPWLKNCHSNANTPKINTAKCWNSVLVIISDWFKVDDNQWSLVPFNSEWTCLFVLSSTLTHPRSNSLQLNFTIFNRILAWLPSSARQDILSKQFFSPTLEIACNKNRCLYCQH